MQSKYALVCMRLVGYPVMTPVQKLDTFTQLQVTRKGTTCTSLDLLRILRSFHQLVFTLCILTEYYDSQCKEKCRTFSLKQQNSKQRLPYCTIKKMEYCCNFCKIVEYAS